MKRDMAFNAQVGSKFPAARSCFQIGKRIYF